MEAMSDITEDVARVAILHWAHDHWLVEESDPAPEIRILDMTYDPDEDLWAAELLVSTRAKHPYVTFWFGDARLLLENRLHIESVEEELGESEMKS